MVFYLLVGLCLIVDDFLRELVKVLETSSSSITFSSMEMHWNMPSGKNLMITPVTNEVRPIEMQKMLSLVESGEHLVASPPTWTKSI